MKVGILGAGATGLSAAWDISRAGHQVTVYERDNFVGGHASTFEIEGTACKVSLPSLKRVNV